MTTQHGPPGITFSSGAMSRQLMNFLIATTNPGKVKEFREMLGNERFNWLGLADVAPQSEVEETGHTFRANAVLKATTYAARTGLWTMADDSGLEVDALDRKPGVHSARWAQMHKAGEGDAANNQLLLEQLKIVEAAIAEDVPEIASSAAASEESIASQHLGDELDRKNSTVGRRARFVCVLAVSNPRGQVIFTTRATMEGRIGFAPVGSNGFGYDPLFVVAGMNQTSAELSPAHKHRISHRGQALESMKQLLNRFLAAGEGMV